MSDEREHLSAVVEEALSEALRPYGAMLTGHIGLVTYLDDDGDRCWALLSSESGTASGDLGMARLLNMAVERGVKNSLFEEG